jgi:hypothetical protein
MTIYLATDDAQVSIPWDKANPALNVAPMKRNRVVRRRLTKPHLYEIGAHTGCGCGFLAVDGDDKQEEARHSASMAGLRSLLESATANGNAQLLVCWIGDEQKPARSLAVTPVEVARLDFESVWDQPLLLSVLRD